MLSSSKLVVVVVKTLLEMRVCRRLRLPRDSFGETRRVHLR